MTQTQPRVQVSALKKKYAELTVIENLNLSIEKGEFISLLGPSGSGKTTLLMILAGFEKATAGSVSLDGQQIENMPPHKRGLGVVFQNYALFPHMSVAENIAFPLKMRNVPKAEIKERVQKALDMVQLSDLGKRKPAQMSGGQQQRIALARALIFEPSVILMDEPFGALDKQLREQMQLDIREMHQRLGLTIVFVTHDQIEALTMSDRIAVFNKGKIEQVAAPAEIYERPATEFVASFIGETNILKGKITAISGDIATFRCNETDLKIKIQNPLQINQDVSVSLRPENILLNHDDSNNINKFTAHVKDAVYRGEYTRLDVETSLAPLFIRIDRIRETIARGQAIDIVFAAEDCWVIPS